MNNKEMKMPMFDDAQNESTRQLQARIAELEAKLAPRLELEPVHPITERQIADASGGLWEQAKPFDCARFRQFCDEGAITPADWDGFDAAIEELRHGPQKRIEELERQLAVSKSILWQILLQEIEQHAETKRQLAIAHTALREATK